MTGLGFVTPAAAGTAASGGPAGGRSYDQRLIASLRAAGVDAFAVPLAAGPDLCAEAAHAAAAACLAALPDGVRPVIDGALLPAFDGLQAALAARAAVARIHYPAALGAGTSAAAHAAVQEAERRLLPMLPCIVATSTPVAERLVHDFAVPAARVRAVVPGTADAARAAGSGGPGAALLAVGALVPRKGHDVLLRALGRLFDLDWTLTVVGSPDHDPVHARSLAAVAEELGIASRVRFAGALDDEALEALWHGADLFALAERWQGYGATTAEALRRGLPVAVTVAGAQSALVPPDAGVVCETDDHAGLSKATRRLIFDVSLRRAMADAAWQAGQALPGWPAQAQAFIAAIAA